MSFSKDNPRILVANPYGIGDVLLTMPLVHNCRLAYPNAEIYYMGNARAEEILKNNKDITEVIVYERDQWHALYKKDFWAYHQKWYSTLKYWRQKQFDFVFDFTMNASFGFFWVLAGIPVRIGYDYKNRGRFLTHRVKLYGFEGKHIVEHHLELLKRVGIPVQSGFSPLPIQVDSHQWVDQWIKAQGIDINKPLIGMVPGGGASWGKSVSLRRWPIENYTELADKIVEELDGIVILMGDQSELGLADHIRQNASFPVYSAIGQTTIMQTAALMKRCKVVIANDGGPMHVACAAGVKTVALFGPVDHTAYGPYPGTDHKVVISNLPCQPCYRRFRQSDCTHQMCLHGLSVMKVWKAVRESLN